ncbi:MAG: hypothetical protein JWM34_4780 [Ilumatobacteraceae bacterium]|nr:hypothetical protein [Ilumatobacteraceae bacterium]
MHDHLNPGAMIATVASTRASPTIAIVVLAVTMVCLPIPFILRNGAVKRAARTDAAADRIATSLGVERSTGLSIPGPYGFEMLGQGTVIERFTRMTGPRQPMVSIVQFGERTAVQRNGGSHFETVYRTRMCGTVAVRHDLPSVRWWPRAYLAELGRPVSGLEIWSGVAAFDAMWSVHTDAPDRAAPLLTPDLTGWFVGLGGASCTVRFEMHAGELLGVVTTAEYDLVGPILDAVVGLATRLPT